MAVTGLSRMRLRVESLNLNGRGEEAESSGRVADCARVFFSTEIAEDTERERGKGE